MQLTGGRSWQWYVSRAEHLKAVERTEIYLYDIGIESYPWAFVSRIDAAAAIKHGPQQSIYFDAAHPSGLLFKWAPTIWRHRGGGCREGVDNAVLLAVLKALPAGSRETLQTVLYQLAGTLQEQAREFQEIVRRDLSEAAELMHLSMWRPS